MSTWIYGSSDDLIEFEGDFVEEITAEYDEPTYISLSNGLMFKVIYTGDWDILHVAGDAKYVIHPVGSPEALKHNFNDYSAVLEVIDPFEYAMAGKLVRSMK